MFSVQILFLQLFIGLKLFPKKNVKNIPQTKKTETKVKQQKHLVTEVRQMKKAKRSLREDRGSPELGVVTATTWKRDTKQQRG